MASTEETVNKKINAFDMLEDAQHNRKNIEKNKIATSTSKNADTPPIDYTKPISFEKTTPKQENSGGQSADTSQKATRSEEKTYVDSVSPITCSDPIICGLRCNPQMRTLTLTMTLFASITFAQCIASLVANSLALLGDCASMLVDTLTYAGNIAAETCQTDQRRRIRNQLFASGFSLFVLILITMFITVRAITRLLDYNENDEEVNAFIVFGFAIGGLCFDLSSFLAFYFWNKDTISLNMKSALLHVFSDTLRSLTTLVESIVIWHFDQAGGKIDAWASIIVSGLIFFGAFGAIIEWIGQFMKYRNQIPLYETLLEESFYVPGEGRENILVDEV